MILYLQLQDFPPQSKLDSQVYGDHTSQITKEHLEPNLEGLTVDEVHNMMKLCFLVIVYLMNSVIFCFVLF